MKIEGVPDADLRRSMVPSGTTLLGMVKHLAYVERSWFQNVFMGREVDLPWTDEDPEADFRIEPGETTEQIVQLYRDECEKSRGIISEASLDDLSKGRPDSGKRSGFSLRWIVVHMIEETARHNGHTDILREQIDGVTGE